MGSIACDLGVAARVIQDNKILLVKEGRGRYQNHWSLPKGSVGSGESPESAVLRELEEETGAQGRILGLTAVRSTISNHLTAVFLCYDVQIDSQGESMPCDEILESKWIGLSELKNLNWVSDTMHNLAIDGLSGSRLSIHSTRPLSKSDKSYHVYSINRQSKYVA